MNTMEAARFIEKYGAEAFEAYQKDHKDIINFEDVSMVLNRLLDVKSQGEYKLNQSQISKRSGLSKSYINDLFSLNPKKQKKPSRDVLLRIGFAMNLSKEEIDTLLKVASFKELYPKNPRDIAIMVSLERGYSLEEANDYLAQKGLPPLEK